jgi:hypothetical protein
MGAAGNIEKKATPLPVECNERRIAVAPVGNAGKELPVGGLVLFDRLQHGVHGARVGKTGPSLQVQRLGFFVKGGDLECVVRADENGKRCVIPPGAGFGTPRPAVAQPLYPVGRKMREEQRHYAPWRFGGNIGHRGSTPT